MRNVIEATLQYHHQKLSICKHYDDQKRTYEYLQGFISGLNVAGAITETEFKHWDKKIEQTYFDIAA